MPYKNRDPYRQKFEPLKYRVTNWAEYNKALKERGNITIWFDPIAIKRWYARRTGKPGAQKLYSNLAIKIASTIRLVLHLPLSYLLPITFYKKDNTLDSFIYLLYRK